MSQTVILVLRQVHQKPNSIPPLRAYRIVGLGMNLTKFTHNTVWVCGTEAVAMSIWTVSRLCCDTVWLASFLQSLCRQPASLNTTHLTFRAQQGLVDQMAKMKRDFVSELSLPGSPSSDSWQPGCLQKLGTPLQDEMLPL